MKYCNIFIWCIHFRQTFPFPWEEIDHQTPKYNQELIAGYIVTLHIFLEDIIQFFFLQAKQY